MQKDSNKSRRLHQWIEIKDTIHNKANIPHVTEGEIWWSACGENIGVEINGKSKQYARPILIYKKLNRLSFMSIPLTSQPKVGNWYIKFEYQRRDSYAVLAQARVMSIYRLYDRIGEVGKTDFERIKTGFVNLYS